MSGPVNSASESPEDVNATYPTSVNPLQKTRSRRGSLRKKAILGTGRMKLERKATGLGTVEPSSIESTVSNSTDSPLSSVCDDYSTPRPPYEKGSMVQDTDRDTHVANQHCLDSSEGSLQMGGLRQHPAIGDLSTTDEDEVVNFKWSSVTGNGPPILKQPSSDAYFPTVTVVQRRRSANKAKSPLAALPIEPLPAPEEWDYSETEWWGWVVLVVTWAVFVMGIGSCFEVWSWAWDVGETPYAPPELEDDPTLPIVGYYPALIILTGVMAWVWVVVAWVGMKYFRHAKIPGDDT